MYTIDSKIRIAGFDNYADEIPLIRQAQTLYRSKFQIHIIIWIPQHNGQPSPHTLVKKHKGGARVKELIYEFESLDIFIDSQQDELAISIAMLTSLLCRELLTQQQYNECVSALEQLYTA